MWSSLAKPEKIKTELGQRIREIRKNFGDPDRQDFSLRLGISAAALGNYERGDRLPDSKVLAAYREKLGVDANWVITGKGGMFERRVPKPGDSMLSAIIDPTSGSGGFLIHALEAEKAKALEENGGLREASGLEQEFVVLPRYEVQASAGSGIIPVDEQLSDSPIAFGRPFLRALGARPDACILLPSKGDSMLPTIPDGSLMVVDRSQTEIDHGCIYVFTVGHSVLVKRARWRMDGKLELVSDNGAAGYPIEIFGPDRVDELSPVGRVVYFCRIP